MVGREGGVIDTDEDLQLERMITGRRESERNKEKWWGSNPAKYIKR